MKKLVEEMEEREKYKEEYDAVANIKKLTIVELEKILNNTITPKGYIKLELSQPEFEKQLIVNSTAQDDIPLVRSMETVTMGSESSSRGL